MIDFENILDGNEADFLFGEPESVVAEAKDDLFASMGDDPKEEKTEDQTDGDLFAEDSTLESVGEEENKNQNGEETPDLAEPNKPSPSFYASIAKALADEGVFSDFDINEEDLKNVKTADDFLALGRKWSEAIRNEDDQRILNATKAGVEATKIRQYEQTLRQLDSFKESDLKQEGQQQDQVRKQIIYQDYINRGFSQERALKATERSFAAGTDVEDALESLASVKEYFTNAYNEEIAESSKAQEAKAAQIKKDAESLKKDLLESTGTIAGLKLDKTVRQKAYDAITKPVAKDEYGNQLTAIQKFEKENPLAFRKAVGALYAVTDGFKDIGKVVKQQAKSEVRRGMTELEHALRNGVDRSGGSFQLAGAGGWDDMNQNESFILA
jgi:hypothetical protein